MKNELYKLVTIYSFLNIDLPSGKSSIEYIARETSACVHLSDRAVDTVTKDFPKERYNTYAKSCNSNLYTKYPGATYSGLLLGTMRCL